MPENDRPLSPHVSVYKWQVANTLSILHRATGVFMTLGALALAAWIISAAMGEQSYDYVTGLLASPAGLFVLLGLSFAFFYHMANGIRHLVWDAGYGFEKQVARMSGWFTFIAAIVLTALFWLGVMA